VDDFDPGDGLFVLVWCCILDGVLLVFMQMLLVCQGRRRGGEDLRIGENTELSLRIYI